MVKIRDESKMALSIDAVVLEGASTSYRCGLSGNPRGRRTGPRAMLPARVKEAPPAPAPLDGPSPGEEPLGALRVRFQLLVPFSIPNTDRTWKLLRDIASISVNWETVCS
jgi:hypothetical protein